MLSVHVDPTRLLNSSFPSPLWPCLLSVRLFDWLAWIPCYSEVPYTKWLGSRSSIQLRQVRVAPCCWIPVFPGFFCWLMFLLKVVVITWMCLQHSLRPSLSPNRFPTLKKMCEPRTSMRMHEHQQLRRFAPQVWAPLHSCTNVRFQPFTKQ